MIKEAVWLHQKPNQQGGYAAIKEELTGAFPGLP